MTFDTDHEDDVIDADDPEERETYLCAACDDRDEYSPDFHWEIKEGWPGDQQVLVCGVCGSDRLYVVKVTP
jgi:hypothetical protein